MNKLHLLLLERRALLIEDFLKSNNSIQSFQDFKLTYDGDSISFTCASSANLLNIYRILEVSDYVGMHFDLSGSLLMHWGRSSKNLTVRDLLKFGILDESKVAYVATYEASDEPCNTECRLLGVYSSFAELQLQFSELNDLDDITVYVVKLNDLEDVLLNGYQE
jgi:hypothetical protein